MSNTTAPDPRGPEPAQDHDHHPEPAEKVRLRSPADTVSAIPYLIGFHPGEGDIIAVFTHRTRSVCATVTRLTDPDDLTGAWQSAATTVTTFDPTIDGAVLIAYLGPNADAALRELPRHGVPPLNDILRVHSGRVWSLTCPTAGPCCPPDGIPVSAEAPHFAATFAALDGTGPLPERAGLGDCLKPGPTSLLTQTQTYLHRLTTDPEPALLAPEGAQVRTPADWFALLVHEHELRADGPLPLESQQAALLLVALRSVPVRDACLIWHDDAAWWLWLELIRHAPPGWVAPVATLIAITAFQQGRPTQARMAAEHALADTPGYSLARTLLDLINVGLPAQALTDELIEACRSGLVLTTPTDSSTTDTHPRTPADDRATPEAP